MQTQTRKKKERHNWGRREGESVKDDVAISTGDRSGGPPELRIRLEEGKNSSRNAMGSVVMSSGSRLVV